MNTAPTQPEPGPIVNVLDEDHGLAGALAPEELRQARRLALARTVVLGPGLYRATELFPRQQRTLGMLVLDGLIIRRLSVADRAGGELIGPGSLLRPWDHAGDAAPMPFEVSWRVIEPTRLAVLDERMTAATVRWPALIDALIQRSCQRAQTLALIVGIHCMRHVEHRLITLLWHLADRFGRVTRDGTVVPLRLTHADLAELVGAQRPSVSSALARMEREHIVHRQSDRSWLLLGEPPEQLHDIAVRSRNGLAIASAEA